MGGIYTAVIPNKQAEVDASSANYTCPSNSFAIRVNDITAGTSLELVAAGDADTSSVVHDNLAVGEVLVGHWKKILAAGTTCDSVIVQSMG